MKTVLFACVHNAGRSQMAAALFNALADPDKARAVSAGTAPGERVHPEVLSAMAELGIDLSSVRPQKLTDALASQAAVLVTMGCGEACPVVPGLRVLDWPLQDPKGQPAPRVREIRDDVRQRVADMLRAEGWESAPRIGPASGADRAAVGRLLAAAGLPDDIDDAFPGGFAVARSGALLIGCAGLETHGKHGLLRSVAVAPTSRRARLGRALVAARLAAAEAAGLEAVYLLTTDAADFFRALGFRDCARADAPAAVQQGTQFSGGCCASARCLVKRLGATT